jgi:hypothetical protein
MGKVFLRKWSKRLRLKLKKFYATFWNSTGDITMAVLGYSGTMSGPLFWTLIRFL